MGTHAIVMVLKYSHFCSTDADSDVSPRSARKTWSRDRPRAVASLVEDDDPIIKNREERSRRCDLRLPTQLRWRVCWGSSCGLGVLVGRGDLLATADGLRSQDSFRSMVPKARYRAHTMARCTA